jgi:prefoldin subunit 5
MSTERHIHISDTAKAIIGVGTFIIAGLMAREGALEGVELFEEKTNDMIDKVKDRHNAIKKRAQQRAQKTNPANRR